MLQLFSAYLEEKKRVPAAVIDWSESREIFVARRYVYEVVVLGTYRQLPLYVDESVYQAEDGTLVPYVPRGKVLIALSGLPNRMLYAAVAQVKDEETGMAVYEGARIPQVYYENDSDCRWVRLSSRGIPCPTDINSWTVLDAVPES